jgi:hypothetical protein
MNRKTRFFALALFVLLTAGAYAQNATLREGYYQTQGAADHIFIAPNRADAGKGSSPETAFITKSGSYGILTWTGMPEFANIFWSGTGNIVGNEFRINIERTQGSNMAAQGLSIPRGMLAIWTIVDNQTFLDEAGQRWIWRRQR